MTRRTTMTAVDERELGREPIDWEMECLRQDRDRGRLVVKLFKIEGILVEHWDCPSHIGCDALLEIRAVIDGD